MADGMETPTFAQLADWIEGKLSATEAAAVQAAVDAAAARGDEELLATVAWLRAFRAAAADLTLLPPPEQARDRVLRMFEQRRQNRPDAATSPSGLWRRLIATLTRTIGPEQAIAGARGAPVQARRRQMTFECELADIVLNTHRREDVYRLSGQVLARTALDVSTWIAELTRLTDSDPALDAEGSPGAITFTDDLGEFTYETVAPGRYAITLIAPALEIRIAPIELS